MRFDHHLRRRLTSLGVVLFFLLGLGWASAATGVAPAARRRPPR